MKQLQSPFVLLLILGLMKLIATQPMLEPLPMAAQDEALSQTVRASSAADSWSRFKPDYYLLQHASYAGFVAAGIGFGEPTSHGAFELLYGYTPPQLVGQDVQSLTFKGLWRIAHLPVSGSWKLTPLFGLNFFYSPDSELFVRLPDQYPDYYYPPTAIRPAFVFGAELSGQESWRASFEYSILDTELPYFSNAKRRDPRDIGSLGFVYRHLLD